MTKPCAIVLCFAGLLLAGTTASQDKQESAQRWFSEGAQRAHQLGSGKAKAKNVILFVGDGMSLATVAAARIYEGQLRGQTGEENQLSFEEFPYTAFSKTYNTDSQTPDSAGTMTAMITGAKTRMGFLSVDQSPLRGECAASLKTPLTSAVALAKAAGLSTGVVTTTRITHATPAATYAHTPERNWEGDADMPAGIRSAGCKDIAQQLVDFSSGGGLDVVMGGGLNKFLPPSATGYPNTKGTRLDGRNLLTEWKGRQPATAFVSTGSQLAKLNLSKTSRLVGLFNGDHLTYEYDRVTDKEDEPSLAEMTKVAITLLNKNDNGYLLVVEGGRIDHAHHSGNAYRALTDTVAFSDAVRTAGQMTSDQDTLILVTADHAHTMSFVGYPQRGNPILGKVFGKAGEDEPASLVKDLLGKPYTTLVYANGPGYAGESSLQPAGSKNFPHNPGGFFEPANGRPDLSDVDTEHPNFMQEALVPTNSETHGGDDVGIWARGPGAEAVRGTLEQNVIFHLLTQPQPLVQAWLCAKGYCENGVPVKLPQVK
ncbi:MAG TPA: alkaline phosphatase [Arenimonas sp.]|nr:alkaline phosphatase [Arenimonas sp.]